MSRNARIDVEVNTNSAQNKLRELSNETNRINSQLSQNQVTNDASDVNNAIGLLRGQENSRAKDIRKEFGALREGNLSEYNEFENKFKTGKISGTEFEDYRKEFAQSQIGSFSEEREELSDNQKRTNELIEELISRQDESIKDKIIDEQRDSSNELGKGGLLKNLFTQRSELMSGRMNAESDDEIKEYNKKIVGVNKLIDKKTAGTTIAGRLTEGANLGTQVLNSGGNVSGMGISLISKLGVPGMIAGSLLALGAGAVNLGDKRDKNINTILSYRALGDRHALGKSLMDGEFLKYSIDEEEFFNKRKELLLSSGKYQSASIDNTMDAFKLEKGYGINSISNVSNFERQDKGKYSTSENILRMLNVLSEIKDGSISTNNLTLANEKINIMHELEGAMVQKKGSFDRNNVIGLMAGFERMGGLAANQDSGRFIQGTLQGLRGGGGGNMDLLRYQFAREAHPELANSPGEINRIVEEGTDGKYLASTLKGLKKMSDNSTNEYYLYKAMFNGLNPAQRQKLIDNSDNPEVLQNFMGNMNAGSKFNVKEASLYVLDKMLTTDQYTKKTKKLLTDLGASFKEIFTKPIDVNIKQKDLNEKNTVPGE